MKINTCKSKLFGTLFDTIFLYVYMWLYYPTDEKKECSNFVLPNRRKKKECSKKSRVKKG